MSNKNLLGQNGLTLIELLISIAIISITGTIVVQMIQAGFKTSNFEAEQAMAVQDGRDAMDSIKQELRGATQGAQGSYSLQAVDDQNLVYYADVDKDNIAEQVRYYRDGTTLKREIIEPGLSNLYTEPPNTAVIAQYLNNQEEDIFIYYDGENNITTQINEIRLISITLRINVTPDVMPNDYYLTSDVVLRNLKDNL